VDFGEAAPNNGIYADGRTGFYEHNLYPLRYNKAVADITKQITGDNIIWARSAWAGSQRYPIHWGGDAESTDDGMAAELRGGLSFGLSGFSFWSHDVGGFTATSVDNMDKDLFARWLAFGMLSSHSRCHGIAPKEPWNYGDEFMDKFRTIDEMKYKADALRLCAGQGLFRTRPADGARAVRGISRRPRLVAGGRRISFRLEHAGRAADARKRNGRANVYLPPGTWIDYQTGKNYSGGWQHIEAGKIPRNHPGARRHGALPQSRSGAIHDADGLASLII
jgi:alpha-D-xyloside xylohydrolase